MPVHERAQGLNPVKVIRKLEAGEAFTGRINFELWEDSFQVALYLVRRIPGQRQPTWTYRIANPAEFAQLAFSAAEVHAAEAMRKLEEKP